MTTPNMNATSILLELAHRGISIRVIAYDTLRLNPESKLDDNLKSAVIARKPELLRLLTDPPEPITLAAADPRWRVSASTLSD